MWISIYHNISRDAGFGFNTVFTSQGKRESATAAEQHPLVWVFTYSTVATQHTAALNHVYEEFNIGTGALARAYRERRLRSLSVGDVVLIDGTAYSCEHAGWRQRDRTELRILPATDADAAVRELYDMDPDEELSVTVPLPD